MTEEAAKTPEPPPVKRLAPQDLEAVVKVGEQEVPLKDALARAERATEIEAREDRIKKLAGPLRIGQQVTNLLDSGRAEEALELVRKMGGIPPPASPAEAQEAGELGEEARPSRAQEQRLARIEQSLEAIVRRDSSQALSGQIERELDKYPIYTKKTPASNRMRQDARTIAISLAAVDRDVSVEAAIRDRHTEDVRYIETAAQAQADSLRAAQQGHAPVIPPGMGMPELTKEELPTMDDLKKGGHQRLKAKLVNMMNKATRSRLGA